MPSLPIKPTTAAIYTEKLEANESEQHPHGIAAAQTPNETKDIPLIENAKQAHEPYQVDDPLGNWVQRGRRRK